MDVGPLLEYLITTGPIILFRRTPADDVTYVSPNVERVLGYTPSEVLSTPGFWSANVHPGDRDRFRAQTVETFASRSTELAFDYRFLHRDGSYRWIHGRVHIEYDKDENPSVLDGYAIDVSERKFAEEAFLAAHLEVAEAREEAERANSAKSEFLSRMSHELRTPLNAVLGFAQLLETDVAPEHRERVAYILSAGRLLLQLIDEVLDIARIERGQLALSIEPVPLDDVVRESVDLLRPPAISADVTIDVENSCAGRYVRADRQRLKQVLMNLLSNAVKYNIRGGRVHISCVVVPSGLIRVSVADTGPGIAPDMLARLFLPFERLGAEGTAIEGTGIGLSICKRLVELMGGAIAAESEVGHGTTLWFELDLADAPSTTEEPFMRAWPVREGSTGSRTVLYVEDNLPNLRLVEMIMTQRPKIRLITAMQGALALDLAREYRPDLVLLDVHLPDMDGSQVLQGLQADPATSKTPVVVISADTTDRTTEWFHSAGVHAYLSKPLDVKGFLALVDEILGGDLALADSAAATR